MQPRTCAICHDAAHIVTVLCPACRQPRGHVCTACLRTFIDLAELCDGCRKP